MAGFRFRLLDGQFNLCNREQDFAWNSCPIRVEIFQRVIYPPRGLLFHRGFLLIRFKNGIILWGRVSFSFLFAKFLFYISTVRVNICIVEFMKRVFLNFSISSTNPQYWIILLKVFFNIKIKTRRLFDKKNSKLCELKFVIKSLSILKIIPRHQKDIDPKGRNSVSLYFRSFYQPSSKGWKELLAILGLASSSLFHYLVARFGIQLAIFCLSTLFVTLRPCLIEAILQLLFLRNLENLYERERKKYSEKRDV